MAEEICKYCDGFGTRPVEYNGEVIHEYCRNCNGTGKTPNKPKQTAEPMKPADQINIEAGVADVTEFYRLSNWDCIKCKAQIEREIAQKIKQELETCCSEDLLCHRSFDHTSWKQVWERFGVK